MRLIIVTYEDRSIGFLDMKPDSAKLREYLRDCYSFIISDTLYVFLSDITLILSSYVEEHMKKHRFNPVVPKTMPEIYHRFTFDIKSPNMSIEYDQMRIYNESIDCSSQKIQQR